MKKLLLSLITGILLISNSEAYETKVNFETYHYGKFILYVNGQKMNYQPANFITLDYLPSGRSNIRVEYYNNRQFCNVYKSIYLEKGYETFFEIKSNRYGDIKVYKTNSRPLYRKRNNHYYHNPATVKHNNRRFNEFLYKLDQKRFDGKKFNYATAYIQNNYISVRQLVKILNGFSFDDTKVDLIIYSYDHLNDPKNLYSALETLRYYTSKREVKSKLGLYSSRRGQSNSY